MAARATPSSVDIINLLKNISIELYLHTFFQIFVFAIVFTAAFFAGLVNQAGFYIIPLLDKDIILDSVALYMTFFIGTISFFRFLLLPFFLLLKEEYASNWSSKKLLGIASIFVVIVITLALALNSVVGGITALILINRVAVLQILALFIFAVFLQFALASKKLEAYQQKSSCLLFSQLSCLPPIKVAPSL